MSLDLLLIAFVFSHFFFFFMSALVARFNFALLFFAYYVGVKLPLFLTQEKLVCVVVLW